MKETPILMCDEMVRPAKAGLKTETRRSISLKLAERLEFWTGGADEEPGRSEDLYQRWAIDPKDGHSGVGLYIGRADSPEEGTDCIQTPYGMPGDRLWVKETFYCDHYAYPEGSSAGIKVPDGSGGWRELNLEEKRRDMLDLMYYRADGDPNFESGEKVPWKSSLHMPRWVSRLTLGIEKIGIERVQDITLESCRAEGFHDLPICVPAGVTEPHPDAVLLAYRTHYRLLWNSLNLDPKECRGKGGLVVGYKCFPWSSVDFDQRYPGVRAARLYRGLPIVVLPNPWVWVIKFSKL